jgi:Tfp pilus assembly protein PilX
VGAAATNFTAFTAANPPQYIIQKVVCPPSAGGAGTGGVSTAIDQVGDLTSQINGSGTCYRATARSLDPAAAGNNNRAIVLLQSTFRS